MKILTALAREGFIDTVDSPQFNDNDNFLDCLKKIFNFEEVDFQEFDGNTAKIINSYDPTNSIFIYENQQGSFIYTITSATPFIHKNNMIWSCNTFKMDDLSKINSILSDGRSSEAVVYKNLAPNKLLAENQKDLNFSTKTETKDNFKPEVLLKYEFGNYSCLKIKMKVKPASISGSLITSAPDGSFNFFFPLIQFKNPNSNLIQYTSSITSDDTFRIRCDLKDVISQNADNIIAVEFLPFLPNSFENVEISVTGMLQYDEGLTTSDVVFSALIKTTPTSSSWVKWNSNCGIFIRNPVTDLLEQDFENLTNKILSKKIMLGGGVNSYLRTPLGNIQLEVNNSILSRGYNIGNLNDRSLRLCVLSDGWKIDGVLRGEIPPHYLNFYTDSTGQLLIQNMTTNAQELRQINREREYKLESSAINGGFNLLSNISGAALSAYLGDYSGAVSKGVNILSGVQSFVKEGISTERDYSKSLAEYNDKIQTQSLLASLTGKSISGNFGIASNLSDLNANSFKIFIELNFVFQKNQNNYSYTSQHDYDYSVDFNINNLNFENRLGFVYNKNLTEASQFNKIKDLISLIFGKSQNPNSLCDFYDDIGLSYSVSFKLRNLIYLGNESISNLEDSLILNFNIRNSTKLIDN